MAQNRLYDFGRESFLDGQISWTQNTVRAVLVDTSVYQPVLNAHRFLTDIPTNARISTSPPLNNKTVTNGVADADDLTFTAVSGPQSAGIAVYRDTGVAGTSRLIAWIEQAVGLPVQPNGGDVTVQWDSGANKIFKL